MLVRKPVLALAALDALIAKAKGPEHPVRPLALAVYMYMAPNVFYGAWAFSDIFEIIVSMVAGRGQAVDLAGVLLYGVLEGNCQQYFYFVLQQYIDDLALQIGGARACV